ncbi:hypothetical protein CGZ93_16380 [Enemella dayhoffiae]|uniref:HTH marR-type domain-containing protein n=1 Tax=Enemella dayhoffiae TaxID=2016507 RepID=A0A255GTR5_9ACTN|nr:MarR family transcriptional regulator [Enemella dayhoffiae]OYO18126.1 hypothetical protein CGZ93_16380 [Enemella dayhoffiae]
MPNSPTSTAVADRLIDAMVSIGRSAQRSSRLTMDRGSYFLLGVLQQRGQLRLTGLAEAADLDVSTTSRHVRQLEGQGLVVGHADPADGRAKLFTLTPAGEETMRRARAERRQLLTERLGAWSADDVAALERLMTRLANEVGQSTFHPCTPLLDKDSDDQRENQNPTRARNEQHG